MPGCSTRMSLPVGATERCQTAGHVCPSTQSPESLAGFRVALALVFGFFLNRGGVLPGAAFRLRGARHAARMFRLRSRRLACDPARAASPCPVRAAGSDTSRRERAGGRRPRHLAPSQPGAAFPCGSHFQLCNEVQMKLTFWKACAALALAVTSSKVLAAGACCVAGALCCVGLPCCP